MFAHQEENIYGLSKVLLRHLSLHIPLSIPFPLCQHSPNSCPQLFKQIIFVFAIHIFPHELTKIDFSINFECMRGKIFNKHVICAVIEVDKKKVIEERNRMGKFALYLYKYPI